MKTYVTTISLATALCAASLMAPQAARADATPECNNGPGFRSTECGSFSSATGDESTAVGFDSQATGSFRSTATGSSSRATGIASTATGSSSNAVDRGTATGASSSASGDSSTALGAFSIASGRNSVALGANSRATEADTVSVGTAVVSGPEGIFQRRIVNVAAGTGQFDAVNVSQLNAETAARTAADTTLQANITAEAVTRATADTALGGRITTLEALNAGSGTRIAALETLTNNYGARISNLELESRQSVGGIAAAMAMGGAVIVPDSNISFSLNLATYRGQQGFSGSIIGRVSEKVYITAGIAGSTVKKSTGGRVGITFGM